MLHSTCDITLVYILIQWRRKMFQLGRALQIQDYGKGGRGGGTRQSTPRSNARTARNGIGGSGGMPHPPPPRKCLRFRRSEMILVHFGTLFYGKVRVQTCA